MCCNSGSSNPDWHRFCCCKCNTRIGKVSSFEARGTDRNSWLLCNTVFVSPWTVKKMNGLVSLCDWWWDFQMVAIAHSALDEYRSESKKMVVALVDMERAFIPPQHFIRLVQRRWFQKNPFLVIILCLSFLGFSPFRQRLSFKTFLPHHGLFWNHLRPRMFGTISGWKDCGEKMKHKDGM